MTTVWLVRHGEAHIPPGVAIGHGDPPLSQRGRRQVAQLAKRLGAEPLRRVFSSDLVRARLTAERIAAVHGLPVHVCPELREIDFGEWEGRSLNELWSDKPDEADAWENNLRCVPSGFGERFEEFESRVARFPRRLDGGELAAVVCHRGPLAVLLHQLTGVSIEEAWRQPLHTGTALKVEVAGPLAIGT
ncbi:histidine phosphatase family protein [bacterium]|nr:MAG: histidine phosphatase family protein [bacterium]